MGNNSDEHAGARPTLRLWPGVAAVVLQWVLRYAVPAVWPDFLIYGILAGMAGLAAVALWWVFFSRATWKERLGGLVLLVLIPYGISRLTHVSIATGSMGYLFPILAAPLASLGFVAGAAVANWRPRLARLAPLGAAVALATGGLAVVRTGGVTGDYQQDLHWRWSQTPEEQLLVKAPLPAAAPVAVEPAPVEQAPSPPLAREAPAPAPASVPEWPGFRGPRRDSVVEGVHIGTDWTQSPPARLWQREVGPGWSSFAVRGDLLFTQEQRGPDEVVACYRVSTGQPVWVHTDAARFWESNAGAGPRATPVLAATRLYSLGATGILNALDLKTGAAVWSRNAAADTGTEVPGWGFSGSPLLYEDLVIVAVSGQLAAYDAATGVPRWTGPKGGISYSSPHLLVAAGIPQVALLNSQGAIAVRPSDGKVLWEHAWQGAPIVQPALASGGALLISTGGDMGGGVGLRQLRLSPGSEQWQVKEDWTSIGLKPYYNDFVLHKGNAFGFDGSILSCIGLEDGKRKWKGGRYGYGQMLLLSSQDLLLVVSEQGDLALIRAASEGYAEVARAPGIEGKTWNHPALIGDVLLVRNAEQMAAFRLPRRRESASATKR